MKKLFVSVPMKGRTEEEIKASIQKMKKIAEIYEGEELELIDSYIEDNPPKDNNEAVWYLGESLKKLAQADVFVGIDDVWNWSMKAYQCGYESAAVSAHKLLKKAKIKNYIAELRNRKMKEIDLREEDLTERLVDIAFSDINDFADVTNGEVVMKDEFDGSLVRSIKNGKYGITFQLEDRVKAIQELRKNFKNDMEEQEERAVIEISEVMEDDPVDTTAETESISET